MALLIIATAVVSFLYTPYDPNRMNLSRALPVPFGQTLAGNGPVWAGYPQPGHERGGQFPDRRLGGRGDRPASFGVLLGSLAAYWRGWRDEGIMRLADVFYGFPAVLSAILITSILGPGMVNSMLAIGIFYIPIFARLTRGASLSVWQRDYVTSARAIGQTNRAIIWSTILPNILSPLIVQATVQFAIAILAEAALSYLGPGNPAAPRELGKNAQRSPDLHGNLPLAGDLSGSGHRRGRPRLQSAGRRPPGPSWTRGSRGKRRNLNWQTVLGIDGNSDS